MLKVAIVGSGFGLYGLLPAFNSLKSCQVVAICGRKTERLTVYCNKIGLKKIYTDWRLMLSNEQLDLLAIAVTPAAQYEIAKSAIDKKINIFAEKPLAATLTQAKILLKLAKKNRIKHTIDFIYPEIPEWKKVKQFIENKKFGELKQICVTWEFLSFNYKNKKSSWKTDIRQGGGALAYYFSHSLYYLEYFAGELLKIKSSIIYLNADQKKQEIGVDMLLNFKNGVSGSAHLNCNSNGLNIHRLVFQFKDARIVLENEKNTVTDFSIKINKGKSTKKIFLLKEKINNGEDERVRIVKKLAFRFVNACIQNKSINPTFQEGVRVQELIEKIKLDS